MAAKKKTARKTTKKKTSSKKKAPATRKKASARKTTTKKKASARKKIAARKTAKKAPAKKAATKKKPAAKKKASSSKRTAAKSKTPAKGKTSAKSNGTGETKAKATVAKPKPAAARRAPMRRAGGMSRLEQLAAEREANPPKVKKMNARDREFFRKLLLNLRDQVVDEISFLAGNNLKGQNVASSSEDGSDNFNREFALKLVSSEQDLVYEIDEALGRIENGTYGICEVSGKAIERERLKVLPHARHCVEVQSEMERGRTRYRPFGPTLSRSTM